MKLSGWWWGRVAAAETSATQAAHIKNALVADLKEILTTLANQQIAAQAQHTGQMSVDVGKAISESLGPPMDAISKAVQGVSANQGEAVNKMQQRNSYRISEIAPVLVCCRTSCGHTRP